MTKKMQLQIEQRVFFGGKNRQILPYFEEKRVRSCHILIVSSCKSLELSKSLKKLIVLFYLEPNLAHSSLAWWPIHLLDKIEKRKPWMQRLKALRHEFFLCKLLGLNLFLNNHSSNEKNDSCCWVCSSWMKKKRFLLWGV